ncbi:MAG: CHASE2 domain-containing protein, partial [Chloroflexota bacterium]
MLKTVYSKRRRLLTALAVATAIGAALCLMAYFRLFHTLQLQSGDFLYRAAASPSATAPPSEIVIVAIDDTSLSQLGSFPSWPRSYHARLTDTLT